MLICIDDLPGLVGRVMGTDGHDDVFDEFDVVFAGLRRAEHHGGPPFIVGDEWGWKAPTAWEGERELCIRFRRAEERHVYELRASIYGPKRDEWVLTIPTRVEEVEHPSMMTLPAEIRTADRPENSVYPLSMSILHFPEFVGITQRAFREGLTHRETAERLRTFTRGEGGSAHLRFSVERFIELHVVPGPRHTSVRWLDMGDRSDDTGREA